jgi:hypothetical protein
VEVGDSSRKNGKGDRRPACRLVESLERHYNEKLKHEIGRQVMNPTDNTPMEVTELKVSVAVAELQHQLNDLLPQLSPERLQVLADFAAYLANAESEAATQELLAIPGLLERVKHNQSTPKTHYATWRTLRSDV